MTKQQLPPDFAKLMACRFLMVLGTQVQAVLLGWQMYSLTKSPLYLGLVGLAEAVPALGFALYAGYIVDRGHPLTVFRRMLLASFLSAAVMFVSQRPGMGFSQHAQVVSLFVASFLTGSARAFSQPSVFALVPRIVPRAHLPRSSAWMTTSLQVARISGPAMGGVLFAWAGIAAASAVSCVMLALAVASSLLIAPVNAAPPVGKRKSMREELLVGAVYVFRHPILFPAMLLDMLSVFFGGVTALLPIYAAEILAVGPSGLGALRAAPAIGAALMSFGLTALEYRKNAGTWLFTAVSGFGVSILVFALSHNLALSVIALGLSGAFDSVSMVIRTAAVQLSSPDSMRGRISAVNTIFISSSNELGEFESGVLARFMGLVPAAVFGAVACLAVVGALAVVAPELRRLNLQKLEGES